MSRNPQKPSEKEIAQRALALSDSTKLQSSIAECKKNESVVSAVSETTRLAIDNLGELSTWQYCLCGGWPSGTSDLRFFDKRVTAWQNKDSQIPIESLVYPGFDLESARLTVDGSGALRISVPGYTHTIPVPECIDDVRPKSADEILGHDHCPGGGAR